MWKNKLLLLIFFSIMFLSACQPSSFDPNLSAIEAQHQAEVFSMMATGTAGAPGVHATETQMRLESDAAILLAAQVADSATLAAAQTSTVAAYTPTPIPTMTPNATSTAVAEQAILEHQANLNRIERERNLNMVWAILEIFALIVVVIITLVASVAFLYLLWKRWHYVGGGVDAKTGRFLPLTNVVDGVTVDIEASDNATVGTHRVDLVHVPRSTRESQDAAKHAQQYSDMLVRYAALYANIPKANQPTASQNAPEFMKALSLDSGPSIPSSSSSVFRPSTLDPATLALPSWELFESWHTRSRPLGLGAKGIITSSLTHLLVSGKTQTGKTGFMLRPQTTASLALGFQVVYIKFSASGFGVFETHPNYYSVELTQASDVIDTLEMVYKEMQERKLILGGASYNWQTWPGGTPPRPFLEIVIDELGNLAEDIWAFEETAREGSAMRRTLWSVISRLANEGLKYGILISAAVQDPTAESIDLRFRRNCTLVSFQQGDSKQSSAFLGAVGAELLNVGHFMARTDQLVTGGGFSPSDDEIHDYLMRHPVSPLPRPSFLEGVIKSETPLIAEDMPIEAKPPFISPTPAGISAARSAAADVIEKAESIRSQWNYDMTKTATSTLLGKPYAGTTWVAHVNAIYAYLKATTTPISTLPIAEGIQ